MNREVLPREQQVFEFGAGRDVRRHDAAAVFQQPVCRAVRCAGVVAVGERRGGIRMGDGIPQFRKAGAGEIDRRLRHGGLQRRVGFGAASRGGAFPRLPGAGGDGRHQRYDVAPCRVAVRSLCAEQHHPRPHGLRVEKRLPDIFPGEVIEVPVVLAEQEGYAHVFSVSASSNYVFQINYLVREFFAVLAIFLKNKRIL